MDPTQPPSRPRSRSIARALVRGILRATLVLAVLAGLFYAVENYRGSRLWSAERQRLASEGTPFEFSQVVPGPVPADSNFAELPELRPLFEYEPGKGFRDTNGFRVAMDLFNYTPRDPWKAREPERLPWRIARPTDLAAWQTLFRSAPDKARREIANDTARLPKLAEAPRSPALDVLDALEPFRPGLDLFARGVRERTRSRYPLRYEDGYACLLPHLALLKGASQRYALRASALIAEKRTEDALADVETIFRLADTLESEPFLISLLVRSAMFDTALQPIWDGLSSHALTASQAAELQNRLSKFDFLPHWRRAMDMERAGAVRFVEQSVLQPGGRARMASVWDALPSQNEGNRELYFRLAPRGWFYVSLSATSRAIDEMAKARVQDTARLLKEWPALYQTNSVRLAMFARFILPQKGDSSLAGGFARVVRNQTHLQLATLALALERHRLAQGSFPESVAALVPTYLPTPPVDPIDGKPLRYRRDSQDGFTLWSIGQDGVDDQGAIPRRSTDETLDSGDWVWKIGP